jgi:hypothetical protein
MAQHDEFVLHLRKVFLLGFMLFLFLPTNAQTGDSELLKRKWFHSVVRIIKGGDGHYYLIRNQSGQYWSFGRAGLHRFEVWRFGPKLSREEVVQVAGSRKPDMITNAYEVLPSPDGIAFLTVARSGAEGLHEFKACLLRFTGENPSFDCRRLATLHEFSPKISQPDVRVAFSPDKSHILITWRLVSGREVSDNSTACMVLDRDLNIVKGPFSPLLGARRDCQLLRIGLADKDRLLFWVRAYTGGNVLIGSNSASFHLLEYDDRLGEVREIRLEDNGLMMMDARLHFGKNGIVSVAGWWINGKDPGRNAGVYFGEIGEADTIVSLQMKEFDAQIRREMLPRLQADGDVWFRPTYNNQLLPTQSGFIYVMHLLGELKPQLAGRGVGRSQNNTLVSYQINEQGQIGERFVRGFCNEARSDYQETYSWIPIEDKDGWKALAADFSEIKVIGQSYLGKNILIPLENKTGKIKELDLTDEKGENWVIAPRLHYLESSGEYLFLEKSRKHYRLQWLHF